MKRTSKNTIWKSTTSMHHRTYSKVALEDLWSPVGVVAADFTRVADVQSMQFVQPVGYRLEEGKTRTKMVLQSKF